VAKPRLNVRLSVPNLTRILERQRPDAIEEAPGPDETLALHRQHNALATVKGLTMSLGAQLDTVQFALQHVWVANSQSLRKRRANEL
jgi:hypothetical protein